MNCARCSVQMVRIGDIPIRVGGKTGMTLFFLQEWAELSERIVKFEAYRCPRCGEVAFFDLDGSLPMELRQ